MKGASHKKKPKKEGQDSFPEKPRKTGKAFV